MKTFGWRPDLKTSQAGKRAVELHLQSSRRPAKDLFYDEQRLKFGVNLFAPQK